MYVIEQNIPVVPLNRLAGVFTERGLSSSPSLSAAGATLPLSEPNLRLIEVIHGQDIIP